MQRFVGLFLLLGLGLGLKWTGRPAAVAYPTPLVCPSAVLTGSPDVSS